MDTRPVLLDFFCGEGLASAGYAAAGFRVIGMDIELMPRYPFEFVQGDAISDMPALVNSFSPVAIAGSPPMPRLHHLEAENGKAVPAPYRTVA